jgi:hypothetical protein
VEDVAALMRKRWELGMPGKVMARRALLNRVRGCREVQHGQQERQVDRTETRMLHLSYLSYAELEAREETNC